MPILSPTGRSLMGVGDGIASVDNVPIQASFGDSVLVRSGAMGWLDDIVAVIAGRLEPIPAGWHDPDGIGVFAYHTGVQTLAVLAQRPSVKGFANGSMWAAYMPGIGTYGSYGDIGEKFIAAIGPDGRAVYAPHGGQPYRWVDTDELLYAGLLEPGSVQVLGIGRVVACTPNHRVITFGGLRIPQTVGKISTPRAVTAPDGSLWLLCYAVDQGRILLHPWDSTTGYVVWDLNTQGDFYRYDVCGVPHGIRVVGASREGEQPGELIRLDLDLSLPRIPLTQAPQPEPEPEPEPMPEEPESLLPTVQAVRAKYPTPPANTDLGKMLNEIAWTHRAEGWGVNLKPSGNSTMQPGTGIRIAVDILHHKPTDTIWDCFRDAGGETIPTWGEAEPHGDPNRIWVAPVRPDGVEPDPDPDPEPEPEPDVLVAILGELRKLNQHLGVKP